jgi:hypothetical protein
MNIVAELGLTGQRAGSIHHVDGVPVMWAKEAPSQPKKHDT